MEHAVVRSEDDGLSALCFAGDRVLKKKAEEGGGC
jgi:hypothetical protein